MRLLLAVRFLAELGMLTCLAVGGWQLGGSVLVSVLLGVALPSVAAAVWGRWVAPRAQRRLPDPARLGVEVILFGLALLVMVGAAPSPAMPGVGTSRRSGRRAGRRAAPTRRARVDATPGALSVVRAPHQGPGMSVGGGSPVALREVRASDLDALFRQMSDPESVRMAAFTSEDPGDRRRFDAHMARVLSSPDVTHRSITYRGALAGSIAGFVVDGQTEVTYWVDRALWGRGIASQALVLLLDLVPTRPLYARAASDNIGSLRVLEKAGFRVVGTEVSFAPGRGAEIEETILRLDQDGA
jgi:RimJ/RimL family protein N-acetyltransferase